MQMPLTLERIVYGSADADDSPQETILALSDNLSPQDAALWRGLASLQPGEGGERAYGIFAGPRDRFVMGCAYETDGSPIYEYLVLPRPLLTRLAGSLDPLVKLFDTPFPHDKPVVPPLQISTLNPWTERERRASFERLLNETAQGDFRAVMGWLGATLQERGLMIVDYPPSAMGRLAFIQGLMALLPASARPDLTFSTQRHEKIMTRARLVFAGRGITTGRWVVDWAARTTAGDEVFAQPYIKRLLDLWDGDVSKLLSAVDQMDAFAVIHTDRSLQASLAVAAERHDLDTRIQAGERLPPEALKTVLRDLPPEGDLKRTYADQLMRFALQTRDADAALIVARLMDADPQLDQVLQERLNRELELNPDVVYAFLRARVAVEQDERWTLRLRAAALASLRVAILDGDSETLINWLKLIAREPASYQLVEVLHNGILASLERARTDPELAQALLVLAIRRDPAALEIMLADQALIDSLPNGLAKALRTYEGDPPALLQGYGAEVFLVALARAAGAKRGELFTSAALEQVWTFYTGVASAVVPPAYTADRIVALVIDQKPVWLSAGALETLIMLLLRERRDELFFKLAPQLTAEKDFLRLLINGMNRSGRGAAELMPMVTQLIASDNLTPQNAADLYVGLLEGSEWDKASLPVMSQLARTLQQNGGVTVSTDVLWRLIHAAADAKDEQIARVALRRLTADLETIEDEEELVDALDQLFNLLSWNATMRAQLIAWWRGFVRVGQPARLGRLDKALVEHLGEGKRPPDDLRTILQTVMAFRKMLGKRSLSQFAEDVSTAYSVLQGLSESFDPSPRRPVSFDEPTIRAEIDSRVEELSPHELQILANNFKELAQVVATMAEFRSRAGLMRRGDDLDRQLMTGEQQPHSAVDVLKWLSGYLSGTQERPDESDE